MARRKIFTVLLLSFLCIFAVNFTACGKKKKNNTEPPKPEYSYEQQEDGYALTSYNGTFSSAVIPDEIDGHKITAISDDCFKNNTTLFTVELGSNISAIGNNAFAGCSGLHHIVLPNTVTAVGENAFDGCSSMTQILIENKASAETWGENWKGDTAAEVVYVSDVFHYVIQDNEATITEYTGTLLDLIIPDTLGDCPVVSTGTILRNILELNSLWLPKTIKVFEEDSVPSYEDATPGVHDSLKPNSEDAIPAEDDSDSGNIKDAVDKVSDGSEYEKTVTEFLELYKKVYFGGTVEDWCNIALNDSDGEIVSVYTNSLYFKDENNQFYLPTDIVIPESITEIQPFAFQFFNTLKSVTIHDNVTSIGMGAFAGCHSLSKVILPKGITEIQLGTFMECVGLNEIVIPEGVTSIDGAFANCYYLSKVTLPDSLTSIGDGTFYRCDALADVVISKNVTKIGGQAFSGCNSLKATFEDPIGWKLNRDGGVKIDSSILSDTEQASEYLKHIYNDMVKESKDETEDQTNSDYSYRKQGDGYELTGYTGTSSNIVIPDEIDGHTITAIADDCFKNNTTLFTVELGSNILAIGSNAFAGCSGLHHIVLPNTVTAVGENAFDGCSSMTQILIENKASAETWGEAWKGDTAAEVVYVSDIFDYVIQDNEVTITLFKGTSKNFIIPETIEGYPVVSTGLTLSTIYELDVLWLPKSLKSFADDALPFNFDEIPEEILEKYENEMYNFYSSVYYAGTFKNWSKLTFGFSYVAPSNPMLISNHFYFQDETSTFFEPVEFNIPDGETEIKASVFVGLRSLTKVNIPDSVKSIGNYAFGFCFNLHEIDLPDGITHIGVSAFAGSGLTSIELPEGMTEIEEWALNGCMNLQSITIPSTVKVIGAYAFRLVQVESLVIPDGVTTIGEIAFEATGIKSITLPRTLTSIGKDAFRDSHITDVYYDGNWEDWCKIDFVSAYEKDENNLGSMRGTNKSTTPMWDAENFHLKNENGGYDIVTEIILPESVHEIKCFTFYGFKNVTSIILPSGLTTIGDCSFAECSSLLTITIPSSVNSIGESVFKGCNSLTGINFEVTENWEYVTSHGSNDVNAEILADAVSAKNLLTNKSYEFCSWRRK